MQVPIPANGYTNAENLCSHDGWLYFSGYNGSSRQLWRTDGTAEGTQELLLSGSDTPQPLNLSGPMISCTGQLFFRANYATSLGQELYTLSSSTAMNLIGSTKFRLNPNPAADVLSVDGFPPNSTLEIHGTDGRLVLTIPTASQVDIRALKPGVYVARLLDATRTIVLQQKVVVDR